MFGFLVLNKPAGISSRTALDRLHRYVRPAKMGHAGTLDPLATGVLVACLGPATRLVQYVQSLPKFYTATFRLGFESASEDIESELTPVEQAATVTRADIESVLPQFTGVIQQMPPQFSALRVDGKRAYNLARKGAEFDLQPRSIEIHSLSLSRFEYPEMELEIQCGSGTYVRSLGRDIGRAVDSGAVMTELVRTAVGPFHIDHATDLENESKVGVAEKLMSPLSGLVGLDQTTVSPAQIDGFLDGVPIAIEPPPTTPEVAAVDSAGQLIAILRKKPFGLYAPSLNFAKYWQGLK